MIISETYYLSNFVFREEYRKINRSGQRGQGRSLSSTRLASPAFASLLNAGKEDAYKLLPVLKIVDILTINPINPRAQIIDY